MTLEVLIDFVEAFAGERKPYLVCGPVYVTLANIVRTGEINSMGTSEGMLKVDLEYVQKGLEKVQEAIDDAELHDDVEKVLDQIRAYLETHPKAPVPEKPARKLDDLLGDLAGG